jgi:transposase InsO family protein
MEAFRGTLKAEMYYLHRFLDYNSLRAAIEQYIHFYNNERFQERLGGLAPMEYRALVQAAA